MKPISGFYDTRECDIGHRVLTATKIGDLQHRLAHPTWKESHWMKDLLIQVLRYHYLESELEQIQNSDCIKDGDNPFEVLWEAESRILVPKAGGPASSKKPGLPLHFLRNT